MSSSVSSRIAVISVGLVSLACSPSEGTNPFNGGDGGQTDGVSSGDLETSNDSGGEATGGTGAGDPEPDSSGEGTDSGFKFDLPNDGETAGSVGGPCGKVDFLFAIDNSGSMGGFQQNLAQSFPGFIDAIQQGVAAQDYHIMVVDSDALATMGSNVSGCGPDGTCASMCPTCPSGAICACTCESEATECIDASASCDDTHGAGVVKNQSGQDCGVVGGQRFMTDAQPDLAETFQCLALVGDYGHAMERPVTAAIKAITTHSEAGGCNEGFLRDDALLVVTFITDDPPGAMAASQYEDAGYLAHPDRWFDDLVAAKGGNPKNVVVLGVVSQSFGADVFVEFVELFGDRGLLGEVTAPSYDGFFAEAVGLVDVACDEFEPEG